MIRAVKIRIYFCLWPVFVFIRYTRKKIADVFCSVADVDVVLSCTTLKRKVKRKM